MKPCTKYIDECIVDLRDNFGLNEVQLKVVASYMCLYADECKRVENAHYANEHLLFDDSHEIWENA